MSCDKFSYDLHIHSCLSPCGDDDMTPATIAGFAKINGLDICALTDHNTSKNCPAFVKACEFYGVIPMCGMELTTSEDVHMICLFDSLGSAMFFDSFVDERQINYKNKPEIFGNQYIIDEDDNVIGEETYLLINATTISIDEAYDTVTSLGGVCYPAHIDRDSNGIVAVLGTFPKEPGFTAFELNDSDNLASVRDSYPWIQSLRYLVCSDAHRITDIAEGVNMIELDCDSLTVQQALIRRLRGEV